MDYSYFKTEVSKRRRPATTRELTKIAYSAPKSTVSLAEGMPNEETFPFTEISVKLYDGSSFILDESELGAALQYIPTQGYPPLVQALREFQRRAHAPPLWESRDIVVVSGSQDGLSKVLEAVIGTGDPFLVPDSFYPGVEAVVAPHKVELVMIPQDDDGPIPEILRETLRNREISGAKMPKIMYINPTGTNPTGIIIPLERRKEIYRIACEYNFLILDDDPYHFVHFDKEEPKSFLSLDTEGRVIRLDSFSKVISSGLRIGFMTATAPLIASVELHLQSSHLHAPTLSQKVTDSFTGLADFNVPKGGFFLWIKIRGIKNTWKMIMQRGVTNGVIMAPGAAFMKDPSKSCNAIRASFSKASYEEMDLAMRRLAQLIRAELAENDKNNYIENVDT
ncbi:kynurenine alpha-aminoadipate mitochondrial-like protein [Lasius niger]|uniref:Kynurenine alpha-aminoadipate mitochondrial-like protein n=1 Tax=Lasius niger TaxID=67767 RepID=A0A0J7L7M5_LASNI|nr:kynurenine alpha-aminoadipate mitochondrial-like protein [Lasius niger]